MIRVIKRYESRKLYDTEESRYVSLEDIAQWVREGQDVRVIDNATSADVSAQVLTQIILDEGKKGSSFLPTELLHELVRAGEKALSEGVDQVQGKMNRFVQSSIDRLGPVRRAREEMSQLRDRLSQLERALDDLDREDGASAAEAKAAAPRRRRAAAKTAEASTTATAKSATAKSATAKKAVAKKATTPKTTAAPKKTVRRARTTATADGTAADPKTRRKSAPSKATATKAKLTKTTKTTTRAKSAAKKAAPTVDAKTAPAEG